MAGEDTVSQKSGEATAGTTEPRTDAFAPASGAEYGFKDPDKVFPVQEYQALQKTNLAARGEWQPKLKLPDGQPFEVPQDAVPEYPHNKVTESTNPNPDERHRMEIDDTPGDPRVTLVHKNGTGMEMMEKDGLLVVNSFGRMVQLVGDDFEMFVAGNGTVIYKGNLDFTVEGDMNLTVKGDMATTVEGNKTEVVKGTVTEEYQDDHETTVTNNKSTTVGETNTELVLGNKNSFVKQKQSNWVKGDAEFLSGANTHISSQTKTSISSTSLSMTGSTINMAGGAGTIGGPGVYHYGYAWDGDLNVTGAINASGNTALGGDLSVNGRIDAATTIFSPIPNITLTREEYYYYNENKITASDKETNDEFGHVVKMSSDGSTIVVGAYLENNATGAVYIFEKGSDDTWTQSAKITASDGENDDKFGISASISSDGSTIVVGANSDDDVADAAGATYIFEKGSGWSNGSTNQSAKITASDGAAADFFGGAVAISGDGSTVVVGAAGDDGTTYVSAGAAYIFEKGSGWSNGSTNESAKVIRGGAAGNPAENNEQFGISVAVSEDGSTVVVGAPLAKIGANFLGQALVFEKGSGWSSGTTNLSSYYSGSSGTSGDRFGEIVLISEDGLTILVGYRARSPNIYEKGDGGGSGWNTSNTRHSVPTGAPGAGESISLSEDGSRFIIGQNLADPNSISNAGQALVFERSGSSWGDGSTNILTITASDKATTDFFGYSASISGDGATVIIGANQEDPDGVSNAGSSYIYTIFEPAAITPSDPFILDNTLYSEPTASNIGTALAASEEGIMQVTIDPGDKIKQSIDLRQRTRLGLGS